MHKTSWGIVMTAREPAQLVVSNVIFHLSAGASEVLVYLDDPQDPVADMLIPIKGCRVIRCDAAHWGRLANGRRPKRQTRRQSLNATDAYQNSDLDWLIHLDADEFVYQKRPLAEELFHAPRTPGYITLPVRERVFVAKHQEALFDGAFRPPFLGRDAFLPALYGELAPFLLHGMTGHAAGKACVPVGQGLRLAIHAPRTAENDKLPPLHSTSSVLLHYDGLTPLHWVLKLLRYATQNPEGMVGPHRMAQLEFTKDCRSLDELLEFHDMLKAVDGDQNARLTALGMLEHLPFDIGNEARQALDSLGLSLCAADFDREIKTRNQDLLAGL